MTAPLWGVIEDNSIHTFEMGSFIQEVLDFLNRSCANVAEFMKGDLVCSERPEWVLKKDSVYENLKKAAEIDNEVEAVLAVVLPAVIALLKKHYAAFLEGGENSRPSPEDKAKADSIVKHNKFAEHVFACTDQLLRLKPNIHHLSQEAYIMFCLNKTAAWLSMKSEDEQEMLVSKARQDSKKLQASYKKRNTEIIRKREEKQQKKHGEVEQRKARKLKEREIIFRDILYFGLLPNRKAARGQSSEYQRKRRERRGSEGPALLPPAHTAARC